jgi:hypothetical protein
VVPEIVHVPASQHVVLEQLCVPPHATVQSLPLQVDAALHDCVPLHSMSQWVALQPMLVPRHDWTPAQLTVQLSPEHSIAALHDCVALQSTLQTPASQSIAPPHP